MHKSRCGGWCLAAVLMAIMLSFSGCYGGSSHLPDDSRPPAVDESGERNPSELPADGQERGGDSANDKPSEQSPADGSGDSSGDGSSSGQPFNPVGDGDSSPPPTTITTLRFSYTPSDAIFPNPERGFFGVSTLLTARVEKGDFDDDMLNGRTLTNSAIELDEYRNSDLPESLLNNLKAGLDSLRRSKGIKAILRFRYNDGFGYPDAPKEIILRHISQLKPIFQEYHDVIAFLPAGFIGSWGEWHHSTNGLINPVDMRDILAALLDALPRSRMVQIRYPFRKKVIFGDEEVTAQTAFSDRMVARIGHHNDCFLALATADEGYLPNNDASEAEIRLMKEYVRREALYTPVGGETCEMGRRDEGLSEMEYLRWSYINDVFFGPLLEYWKSTGAYPIMQRKLGYRFVLTEARITSGAKAGDVIDVQLELRNEGWANPYNPRPVYLVLEGSNDRREIELKDADPRWWQPGRAVTLTDRLKLPRDLVGGEYRVALWLPDESPHLRDNPWFSVRFANERVWDAARGYNVLGRIHIHPAD